MPHLEIQRRSELRWTMMVALLALAGCGLRSSEPPEAGFARGGIPDLRGQKVMLLPPQNVRGGHGDIESEMVYALGARGGQVDWVTPDRLRDRLERSPELRISLDRLPVQAFLSGRLERIGDPLYGELYRLGAMEETDIALLPVEVRDRPVDGSPGRAHVEVVASLLHLRTGRVIWFGVIEGAEGPAGGLAATASTVEALARHILP